MPGSPVDQPRCSCHPPKESMTFVKLLTQHLGPRAMLITAAYVCVTLYVLQNALLTIVSFMGLGPISQSHSRLSPIPCCGPMALISHSVFWENLLSKGVHRNQTSMET